MMLAADLNVNRGAATRLVDETWFVDETWLVDKRRADEKKAGPKRARLKVLAT
jgi:hypothetical protein